MTEMIPDHAYHRWSLRPYQGKQILIYGVWLSGVYRLVWLTVSTEWLRLEASINDLKNMALDAARSQQ
jgi:hypothetical protein